MIPTLFLNMLRKKINFRHVCYGDVCNLIKNEICLHVRSKWWMLYECFVERLAHCFSMTHFIRKKTHTVGRYYCLYCFSLSCPLFSLTYRPEPHGNHSCITFKKWLQVNILAAPNNPSKPKTLLILPKI